MLRELIRQRAHVAFLFVAALVGWFCNAHSSQPSEASPTNAIEQINIPKGISTSPLTILSSCSGTLVTVPTNDARAVCQPGGGTWNFTVTSVTGNVAKVYINVFTGANPTDRDGDGVYDACLKAASTGQIECGGTSNPQVLTTLVIGKPLLGQTVSYTASAGSYCLRFTASGKGSVDLCITTTP